MFFFLWFFLKVSIEIDGRAKNGTNNLPLVISLITWHMDDRLTGWCAKYDTKIKNNFYKIDPYVYCSKQTRNEVASQ